MNQKGNHSERVGSDEISIKELVFRLKKPFKYLISKWYILVITGIIGGLMGFLFAKNKKTTYTATTTFVLETGEQGGGLGQYAGVAAMVGIDLQGGGNGIFQGDNLLELYKSQKMIEAALLQKTSIESHKTLLDQYLNQEHIKENWIKNSPDLLKINYNNITQPDKLLQRKRDSVVTAVVSDIKRNALDVGKLDKKLSLLKIAVRSNDESFAQELNISLVDQVNDFYVRTKTKKSLETVKILQNKVDSVRSVMNGAISSAAITVDQTPNLNPTRQAQRIAPVQRSQFSAETNKAILGQLVQHLEMSKMNLLKDSPLIQIVDEPRLPLENDKIALLKVAVIAFIVGAFIAGLALLFKGIIR